MNSNEDKENSEPLNLLLIIHFDVYIQCTKNPSKLKTSCLYSLARKYAVIKHTGLYQDQGKRYSNMDSHCCALLLYQNVEQNHQAEQIKILLQSRCLSQGHCTCYLLYTKSNHCVVCFYFF